MLTLNLAAVARPAAPPPTTTIWCISKLLKLLKTIVELEMVINCDELASCVKNLQDVDNSV